MFHSNAKQISILERIIPWVSATISEEFDPLICPICCIWSSNLTCVQINYYVIWQSIKIIRISLMQVQGSGWSLTLTWFGGGSTPHCHPEKAHCRLWACVTDINQRLIRAMYLLLFSSRCPMMIMSIVLQTQRSLVTYAARGQLWSVKQSIVWGPMHTPAIN
jgi:hypothetical protein